ncbi:hypothetical protein PAL_GLEAN10002673 [Pteropus alecto]|uniref:Uncharacterized protein n=1 Tax=Pteropus alecto TaxID=9402 RepID=L5KCF3_PTEAL|nr:hypothetical protein PAL_GLEAN10002673 [Pteropus alecto]
MAEDCTEQGQGQLAPGPAALARSPALRLTGSPVHSSTYWSEGPEGKLVMNNRRFFQEEQHFWKPRELSLGLSTSAEAPFPRDHPAPHWPGGHTLASHHSLSPRLGDSSGPRRAGQGALGTGSVFRPGRKGHAEAGSHEEAEAKGQAPVEKPKSLCGQHSLCSGDKRRQSQPAPGTRTAPNGLAQFRKDRRPGRTAWSDQKATALPASASWSIRGVSPDDALSALEPPSCCEDEATAGGRGREARPPGAAPSGRACGLSPKPQ